jgi:hypothetical protein
VTSPLGMAKTALKEESALLLALLARRQHR